MKDGSPRWFQDRWLLAIITVALLTGLLYNSVLALRCGPDEPRHMNYVVLLHEEQRLPFLTAGGEYRHAHTLHPPLYYALLWPGYALLQQMPGQTEWHVLRLFSLLLCLAALPLVYSLGKRAGGRETGLLAAAFLGTLPMWGMTSATINNDSLSLFTGVLFLYLLVCRWPGTTRDAWLLGLVCAAGAATKASLIICYAAALLAVALLNFDGKAAWRQGRLWRLIAPSLLLLLVLAGPWYIRNKLKYGNLTPVEGGYSHPALPPPAMGVLTTLMAPAFPLVLGYSIWGIFYSLWSQKDWIPEAGRLYVYLALAAFTITGLLSAAHALWSGRQGQVTACEGDRRAILIPLGAFAANWLATLVMALFVHAGWMEGGRYLLPSLAGLMLALAFGWRSLLGPRHTRLLVGAWLVAMIVLNGVCLMHLVTYLNPLYAHTC